MNLEGPHILLIGGGYVLTALANSLPRGSFVITTRSTERAASWRRSGWHGEVVDPFSEKSLIDLRTRYPKISIVIDSVPVDERSTKNSAESIARSMKHSSVKRLIYLSSTGVYGIDDGSFASEERSCAPKSAVGVGRLAAENEYLEAPFQTIILRLSGIYGPGRGIGKSLAEGSYRMIEEGARWTNRIHLEDILETLRRLIHEDLNLSDNEIINVSDDHPVSMREVVDFYVNKFALSKPLTISKSDAITQGRMRLVQNQRVSNAKLKSLVLPILKYPSYIEGAGSEF